MEYDTDSSMEIEEETSDVVPWEDERSYDWVDYIMWRMDAINSTMVKTYFNTTDEFYTYGEFFFSIPCGPQFTDRDLANLLDLDDITPVEVLEFHGVSLSDLFFEKLTYPFDD